MKLRSILEALNLDDEINTYYLDTARTKVKLLKVERNSKDKDTYKALISIGSKMHDKYLIVDSLSFSDITPRTLLTYRSNKYTANTIVDAMFAYDTLFFTLDLEKEDYIILVNAINSGLLIEDKYNSGLEDLSIEAYAFIGDIPELEPSSPLECIGLVKTRAGKYHIVTFRPISIKIFSAASRDLNIWVAGTIEKGTDPYQAFKNTCRQNNIPADRIFSKV